MIFANVFRRLAHLWMSFAHVLGCVNGRIILTVLYLVVIGPYAIIRDLAALFSTKKKEETYWILRTQSEPTLDSLRRLF